MNVAKYLINMQWYTVISIPRIEECFLGVFGDGPCLIERCMMSIMRGMPVERLQIYHVTWHPIFLGTYYHPMAPCYRFTNENRFDHTEVKIII